MPAKKVFFVCVGAVFVILALAVWYAGFHDCGMNAHLNPEHIADGETRMWQAYYSPRPGVRVAIELLGLLREQFGLSYRSAILVARDLQSATLTFRDTRDERVYEERVLPDLVTAYTRLKTAVAGTWDAEEVARAELRWWVLRRDPGQNSVENVGKVIAHEYELLYGQSNEDVNRAGYLRAQAAHMRDAGKDATDWPAVRETLRNAYRALVQGTGHQ